MHIALKDDELTRTLEHLNNISVSYSALISSGLMRSTLLICALLKTDSWHIYCSMKGASARRAEISRNFNIAILEIGELICTTGYGFPDHSSKK